MPTNPDKQRRRGCTFANQEGYDRYTPSNGTWEEYCTLTDPELRKSFMYGWERAKRENDANEELGRCPYCNEYMEETPALKRCRDVANCGYHIHQ